MYIRNEGNNIVIEVKTPEDIAVLDDVPAVVKWLFSSVLKTIGMIDGATSEASRLAFRYRLDALLDQNPRLIECAIVCDDRNNPPDVVAKCQTLVTVQVRLDFSRGEYIYSFSTKELV